MDAELRYAAEDPFAVEALFNTGEPEPVRWVFARELLASGLLGPTGEGDVGVSPSVDDAGGPAVRMRLSSPDGHALLEAPAGEVSGFLRTTYEVVPPGCEGDHLRIDETLEALLDR